MVPLTRQITSNQVKAPSPVDAPQTVDVEDNYKVFLKPADIAGKLLAHGVEGRRVTPSKMRRQTHSIADPIRQQRLEALPCSSSTAIISPVSISFSARLKWARTSIIMALSLYRLMEPVTSGCASGMAAKFFGARIS